MSPAHLLRSQKVCGGTGLRMYWVLEGCCQIPMMQRTQTQCSSHASRESLRGSKQRSAFGTAQAPEAFVIAGLKLDTQQALCELSGFPKRQAARIDFPKQRAGLACIDLEDVIAFSACISACAGLVLCAPSLSEKMSGS